jgi:acetyltransferase-like isoleucine patch superfamily enzyme
MSSEKKTNYQVEAFERMLEGKGFTAKQLFLLSIEAAKEPFRTGLSNLNGPMGYALRRLYYKRKFKHLGKNCILDIGLKIISPENISVGEYTWIDRYAAIYSMFGEIKIGKRIHISPNCIINCGEEGVELEDYVGLSTGAHVYGHTQAPVKNMRMSGPMVPNRYKAVKEGKVRLLKDSFLGAYSLVMPGVTIGEGAVIGAHSIVTKDIPDWSIAVGCPAKVVGKRDKLDLPEL